MNDSTKLDVSGQQLERLAHIEFVALFTGKVTRKDLMTRFEISQAVATRDLSLYRELARQNLQYDTSLRYYVASEDFKPIFEVSPYKCLSTLLDGFGDSLKTDSEFKVAYAKRLRDPKIELIAAITRAISLKKPLLIKYFSVSSQSISERVVVPHSLVDSGLRWHVRAWDRAKSRFADFVVNRISFAQVAGLDRINDQEGIECDSEWQEEVELIIQPHPSKPDIRKIIELEFGMVNGVLIQRVRKALVGYMLDSWNVDSSLTASLKGHHVMLHLKNASELQDSKIKNLHLAPA